MNFGPGLTFEPGHFCMVKFGSDIAAGPLLHRTAVKLGLEPCHGRAEARCRKRTVAVPISFLK